MKKKILTLVLFWIVVSIVWVLFAMMWTYLFNIPEGTGYIR